MVPLVELWLPILLAAVGVFLVSWILHVLLPIHRNDFSSLENEEALAETLRAQKPAPGQYTFPYCKSMQEMQSEELQARYRQGPVGILTIYPDGVPPMGKMLLQWLLYCLGVSVIVAYLGGRSLPAGASLAEILQIAGTAATLVYASPSISDSIWKGTPWIVTLRFCGDGLIYGLTTGFIFAFTWPAAAAAA